MMSPYMLLSMVNFAIGLYMTITGLRTLDRVKCKAKIAALNIIPILGIAAMGLSFVSMTRVAIYDTAGAMFTGWQLFDMLIMITVIRLLIMSEGDDEKDPK